MAALPGGTDVAITHKFVSGKADGPDPTLVQPSKWNQDENLGAGADGQKIARDSGQADGGSWVNYDAASYTNSTGGTAVIGDVVAVSVAADNAVVLDDTVSSLKKFVVALQAPANAAVGAYAYMGPVPGVKAQGAIAAGQYVRKSATTKAVEDAGTAVGSATAPPAGAIGFATSAAAAGFVNIYLFPATATGGSVLNPKGQVRLTKSGANLLLSPFNGNLVTVNSVDIVIPDAGITLGVGGLAASTAYFIYLINTTTMEASTTAPVIQAGTGVYIKTGDATRTLVGQAATDGGTAWVDTDALRYVLSYFNRRRIKAQVGVAADRTTTSATVVEMSSSDRVGFMSWADEVVEVAATGRVDDTVSIGDGWLSIGIDGTATQEVGAGLHNQSTPNMGFPFGMNLPVSVSQGVTHYATILGISDGAATVTLKGGTAPKRSSICVYIKG